MAGHATGRSKASSGPLSAGCGRDRARQRSPALSPPASDVGASVAVVSSSGMHPEMPVDADD